MTTHARHDSHDSHDSHDTQDRHDRHDRHDSHRIVSGDGGSGDAPDLAHGVGTPDVMVPDVDRSAMSMVGGSPTVAEYVERWLVVVAARGRAGPATVARYRMVCELYVLPWLGDRPVSGLTGAEVQEWMRRLGSEPWRSKLSALPPGHPFHRPVDRLSPATVIRAWELLRGLLNVAVGDGVAQTNVALLAAPPSRGRPRRSPIPPWTAEEALRFLDSARQNRDTLYPAYVLILLAGLRVHEALGLAWADVDLGTGTARITHGLHTNGTTGTVRRPIRASARTPNPYGPVRLPDPCLAVLRHHRAVTEQALTQQALTGRAARRGQPAAAHSAHSALAALSTGTRSGEAGCGLVVTTVYGRPVSRAYFRKRFRARANQAGVRMVSPGLLGPTTPGLLVALHVPPPVAIGIIQRRQLATPRQLAAALGRVTRQPYPPIRPPR